MKIKICGLTRPCEAEYLNEWHIDFAGMILFYPKSRRNISLEQSAEIRRLLDPAVNTVAVTVSPTVDEVMLIAHAGFNYIQIHGRIPADLSGTSKLPVFKAFNVSDIDQYNIFENDPSIAGFVFDASVPGSGRTFDWDTVRHINRRSGKYFILAGGLNSGNVRAAVETLDPDVVDVSSGVEYSDRLGKDPQKISDFVRAVRSV